MVWARVWIGIALGQFITAGQGDTDDVTPYTGRNGEVSATDPYRPGTRRGPGARQSGASLCLNRVGSRPVHQARPVDSRRRSVGPLPERRAQLVLRLHGSLSTTTPTSDSTVCAILACTLWSAKTTSAISRESGGQRRSPFREKKRVYAASHPIEPSAHIEGSGTA
jgi:hypothetical protein